MNSVKLTGLEDILIQLDRIGKEGDEIAREASTKAATLLRQNYLVSMIRGEVGISRNVIMRYTKLKKATAKYEHARINFSGAGVPVSEYNYRQQRVSETRARIIIDWVGGEKVAAGFINPKGKKAAPLSSRNQRTTKNGKTYTYKNTRPEEALGLSIATLYQALPSGDIEKEAVKLMGNELIAMLDDIFGEE